MKKIIGTQFSKFDLKQLLIAAMLKEDESVALYSTLYKKSATPTIKKLFKKLYLQEKKHKHFYSQLAKTIAPQNKISLEKNNEYTLCMLNFLEEHRASFLVTLNPFNSEYGVLNYAILREKHSILFYIGLRNYSPCDTHSAINNIIKEEMQHAEKLIALKQKIKIAHH